MQPVSSTGCKKKFAISSYDDNPLGESLLLSVESLVSV